MSKTLLALVGFGTLLALSKSSQPPPSSSFGKAKPEAELEPELEPDPGPLEDAFELRPVAGHPYVSVALEYDNCEEPWIKLCCSQCGCDWQRQCSSPERRAKWIYRFCVLHGHGYLPTLPAQPSSNSAAPTLH